MPFAEWDHLVKALVPNRPHEALRGGVRIGCLIRRLHDADSRLAQPCAHRRAPLRVPVTGQHARADQDPLVCGPERAADLVHEHLMRMRSRTDDRHTTGGEVGGTGRCVAAGAAAARAHDGGAGVALGAPAWRTVCAALARSGRGHALPDGARSGLVFSTWPGKPIGPNNVLRRWVWPLVRRRTWDERRGSRSGERIRRGRTIRACRPR